MSVGSFSRLPFWISEYMAFDALSWRSFFSFNEWAIPIKTNTQINIVINQIKIQIAKFKCVQIRKPCLRPCKYHNFCFSDVNPQSTAITIFI